VAIVMMSTAFLLLTGYYLLKTARKPMILLQGGAEVKQYAAAAQAVLLVAVVRGYSWLAKRVGRSRLLTTVFRAHQRPRESSWTDLRVNGRFLGPPP
jgi:hypothetical protein